MFLHRGKKSLSNVIKIILSEKLKINCFLSVIEEENAAS